MEFGKTGSRADERGAAGTHNGPDSTSRTEAPHPARGHDARIPCNGRYERGEGGCHALQADPVDGSTSQGNHPRDPHPVHGIFHTPADWCPATPGEEPSTAAERTAATPPAREVKPTTGEPSPAPTLLEEHRSSPKQGVPQSAPVGKEHRGTTATAPTSHHPRGETMLAPKLVIKHVPQRLRDDRKRPLTRQEAVPPPLCKLSLAEGAPRHLRHFQKESYLKTCSGMTGTKEPKGSRSPAPNPMGPTRQWGSCQVYQRRGKRRGASQPGYKGEQPGSLPQQKKVIKEPGLSSVHLTLLSL